MDILSDFTAIILASGRATRLGNECSDTPKCLLEFNGVPFLHYLINWILNSGVKEIVVTACVHSRQIEDEIFRYWPDVPVQVATEKVLSSTVASTLAGINLVSTDHVCILTADTVWETSLSRMCMDHLRRDANGTALLTTRDSVPNQGKVKVLNSGMITRTWKEMAVNETEESTAISASTMGIYTAKTAKILQAIDVANDTSIEREPFSRLRPDIWAFWCEGVYLDYGTPKYLRFLQKHPEIITECFGEYRP